MCAGIRQLVWMFAAGCGLSAGLLTGAEPAAAELLPGTTAFYAEWPAPAETLHVLWDHPLRARVEELEEFQAAQQKKEYLAFQGILQYVEGQLGMGWREAVEGLTAQGVVLAFDPATNGVALLIRARDESTLAHLRDVTMELVRADARQKGRSDPYTSGEYRGLTVYKVGQGYFATVGDRLLLVNKSDLGQAIVDRLLDHSEKGSLAAQPRFTAALESRPTQRALWSWMDIEWVREQAKAGGKPFEKQTDNPVAELLLGGLLDTFQHTPWLTASLRLAETELGLQFHTPHQADWVTESRTYYFGPAGAGTAPPPPEVREQLLSLGSYRNISEMWLRAGDLFPENVVDKLAEADSNLALFFSGKDFGEDILGALEPTLEIVAARQHFSEDRPIPAIKLPSLAVQFDLREPGSMSRDLKRTFQSIIGFANVTGAMQGHPQLEIDMPAVEGMELAVARFLPRQGEEQSREAPIQFNFSPTVAFVGKRFVLASTEELARELASASTGSAVSKSNTILQLSIPVLGQVLADNYSHLVAQNILKEGHSKAEAERQIDLLLGILSVLRDINVHLDVTSQDLTLDVGLRLKPLE